MSEFQINYAGGRRTMMSLGVIPIKPQRYDWLVEFCVIEKKYTHEQ